MGTIAYYVGDKKCADKWNCSLRDKNRGGLCIKLFPAAAQVFFVYGFHQSEWRKERKHTNTYVHTFKHQESVLFRHGRKIHTVTHESAFWWKAVIKYQENYCCPFRSKGIIFWKGTIHISSYISKDDFSGRIE